MICCFLIYTFEDFYKSDSAGGLFYPLKEKKKLEFVCEFWRERIFSG